ncbi:unnamed protein product [Prorocentrum cordatum]|uniref:C2 domain-containing protein n=1 Tax=Prorocentrum cordatum TaxID=2364126 RepID=A0ABN9RG86_9DINO|nr:unnamed protein product [Polarella glacialis]
MEIESQVARGLKMVSQGARRRLLSEERERIQRRATCDPAMPAPLRWFIEAIFRVISEDIVRSIELDIDGDHAADDAANGGRGEEEAAAVARGTLQVLAVEARSLAPAHGIGTNPYVVGLLGQEVRRSWTAWSNLNPDWNFLMEFPVVSLSGSLELEVLSRSPLFGSDTRLGYVSLPVRDITSGGQKGACLAYRREQLQGATQGEIVLILDYKAPRPRPGPGAHGAGPPGLLSLVAGRCPLPRLLPLPLLAVRQDRVPDVPQGAHGHPAPARVAEPVRGRARRLLHRAAAVPVRSLAG